MAENTMLNKLTQKKYFGVPLLKPNSPSESKVRSKVEDTRDLLNDTTMSKMESSQKENYAELDTSYATQTTFDTKSPKSMNMQKTTFPLECDINEADKQLKDAPLSTSLKENCVAQDSCLKSEPKNPVTPFIRWSMSERDNVKKEIGTVSVGEMGHELRKRWAALSSEAKQIYQDKYVEEKEIYEKAININAVSLEEDNMKAKPPKNTELKSKRKLVTPEESERKKIKKIKDPSAPKKPPSAYLLWSKAQREKIKVEMGNLSMVDIGKELGKRWKSEVPKVKDFYEKIYKDKKEKYLKDITNYKTCEPAVVNLSEKAQIEDSMDLEIGLDCLKNTVVGEKENGYKNALRPKKKNNFNNMGGSRFLGSGMVKPYFKFITDNWRESAKMTEEVIPDAGPLDVIDCLNQMWGEREDIVQKYTKRISKKQKKKAIPSSGKVGGPEEDLSEVGGPEEDLKV